MSKRKGDEADRLLGEPLRCDDCGDWAVAGHASTEYLLRMGLTDENGQRTGLLVELRFNCDDQKCRKSYGFGVFKRNQYGLERLYQLEVKQGLKILKHPHQRPHEHWRGQRVDVPVDLARWSYTELLAYFCVQTNIRFNPIPPDPSKHSARKS